MKRPRNGALATEKSPPLRASARHRADTAETRTQLHSDVNDAPCPDPDPPYEPPSKSGRWPKGKSGNKKGRTKGSKNKKTVIIEMMESKLGRKIPDPKKLTRYEAMMFKAIQKALGGDIRSMGFVLSEYRKAIEGSGSGAAAATTEEDQQAYVALCAKIRREIEDEVRKEIRNKTLSEAKK
jgi:hypothetical protein